MHVRTLAAAALAALALGLAACGGEGEATADSQRQSREEARQAELKLAQCMREQGIDIPDPGAEPSGPVKVGGDATPEELREAEEACAKYRDAIKPPELSEEQQQEFKDAALEHARCMREHGIDFPDPAFSEDGGATVRIGPGGLDPDDPDFKEAEEQCAGKLGGTREVRP